MTDYASAGVHRELGNEASRILYEAARRSWLGKGEMVDRFFVPWDDYRGLRVLDIGGLPAGTCMMLGFDGVGSKVEIAERMDQHEGIAADLLAMVCDDAAARGAEPMLVGSILDVSRLYDQRDGEIFLRQIEQIAQGYTTAALATGVMIVNGEIAEMGDRIQGYGRFAYHWGAAVLWFAKRSRLLTGSSIRPGDAIIALGEEGFRSNGISLLRYIFQTHYGEDWHEARWQDRLLGGWLLEPSCIYTRALVAMTGGFEGVPLAPLHGAAHITGGGIPEKLGRLLMPFGYGAHLEALFPPPPLMLHAQELGQISDEEAYRTWHMGQGMLLITPTPQLVLDAAHAHHLAARWVGEVTASPTISLFSQGSQSPQTWLNFSY